MSFQNNLSLFIRLNVTNYVPFFISEQFPMRGVTSSANVIITTLQGYE
jgi:hypothetical protein